MPRWRDWEDDDPGMAYDPEDEDWPDEGDEPTIPCPHCRREVLEDAERCPHCECYLSREDAPARKPWWIILGVILCLLVVYHWNAWW